MPGRATVTTIFQTIAETLKICGPAILGNGDIVHEITAQLVLVLGKKHPAQVDDTDEEDLVHTDESSEFDWMLVDSAMDTLLALAVVLGPQYKDVFGLAGPKLLKYVSSSEPRERAISVGVVADGIKYMEGAVTEFTDVCATPPIISAFGC